MSGGSITDNFAIVDANDYGGFGGGIFLYSSTSVSRTGGTISDNTGGDVYTYGDNSSSIDDSSDENGGSSSVDNSGSDGSADGFSLSVVMLSCVISIVITVLVVASTVFFYFKKKVNDVEKKIKQAH
jgi:hypothetical protein